MEKSWEPLAFDLEKATLQWKDKIGPCVKTIEEYEAVEKKAGVRAAGIFESTAFRDSMLLGWSCSM